MRLKLISKNPLKLDLDQLNKMNLLTAVMKESLRMASPAAILLNRVAIKDHTLGEYNIKKGTII